MVRFFILKMAKPMCDGFSMRRVLIGLENLFCKRTLLFMRLFIYLFILKIQIYKDYFGFFLHKEWLGVNHSCLFLSIF
jgi:hypothetical protein